MMKSACSAKPLQDLLITEGGILVWGIEAKAGHDGVDQAKALKPFKRVKQFKQALEDYTKYATEPIVDAVLHRASFVDDKEPNDEGFVISYFPKSEAVHRALGGNTSDFFKRHGASFTPLSTADIRALFFRSNAPNLMVVVTEGPYRTYPNSDSVYQRTIALKNVGSGVAKFASVYLGLADPAGVVTLTWYDASGAIGFPVGRLVSASHYADRGEQFILIGDCVGLRARRRNSTSPLRIRLFVLA